MKLTIEIHTDNACFGDDPATMVDEVMRSIRRPVLWPHADGVLADSDGNTVGSWAWT